jgi:hypothetical protein
MKKSELKQLIREVINEIAINPEFSLKDENEKLLDNMRSILLGEKIPVNFIDKDTKEVIIPAYTKLTNERLRMLVNRWVDGTKFDITFEGDAQTDKKVQKAVLNALLTALDPEYDWL